MKKITFITLSVLFSLFVLFLTVPQNSFAACEPGTCDGCDSSCVAQRSGGQYGDDCCNPIMDCGSCSFCASRGACRNNGSLVDWQIKTTQQFKQNITTIDTWTAGALLPPILHSLSTGLGGDFTKLCPAGSTTCQSEGGAIGFVSNAISYMIAKPAASSVEYFADLGKNFGVVEPAYAQGAGFLGMSNLLPLWKAVRNFTYIIFVVIFLFTGLAIMFRLKIDPKTAISIQSAIPKLIIAMVLITFSYAIVGLILDLSYVLVYLGVLIFAEPLRAIRQDVAYNQGWFATMGYWKTVVLVMNTAILKTLLTIIPSLFSSVAGGIATSLISANPLIGVLVTALPTLLVFITVFILIFKLFFNLLTTYVMIILSIITAPLQIMMGVLPGKQGGISSWLNNLIANVLVFPAVAIWFFLSWLILTGKYSAAWTAPVGFGGLPEKSYLALLGLGMLFLANKIPDMVKSAFKMRDQGYGKAIGEALGPARGIAKIPVQRFVSSAETDYRNEAAAGKGITLATSNRKSIADMAKLFGFK